LIVGGCKSVFRKGGGGGGTAPPSAEPPTNRAKEATHFWVNSGAEKRKDKVKAEKHEVTCVAAREDLYPEEMGGFKVRGGPKPRGTNASPPCYNKMPEQ